MLQINEHFARFDVGSQATLSHLPYQKGDEIKIPALVREVLKDGYIVDTEYQKGVKVRHRDLI